METKTETPKAFDCVEFKRQSQRRLRAEYEKRKAEFDSYVDFIRAKAHEDEPPCPPAARLAHMKYLLDTNACIQYLNGTSDDDAAACCYGAICA